MDDGAKRNATLDRVRIILALMVVGIHVDLFNDTSSTAEEFFVNHIFRIAVPFFLIATGYYLADKLSEAARFWPWFRRLALLYLFWSAFYLPIMIAGHAAGKPLLGVLHNLLTGFQHLWYLVAALEAALALYIGRVFVAHRWFGILCIVLYVTGVGIEYGAAYGVLGGAGRFAAAHAEVYRNGVFVGMPMMWLGLRLRAGGAEGIGGGWTKVALAAGMMLAVEFAINLHDLPGYHLDLLMFLPAACSSLLVFCLRTRTNGGGNMLPFAASAIYFLHPAAIFMIERYGWLARSGSVETYGAVLVLTALGVVVAIPLNKALIRRTSYSVL